ncbi:MAG TPA: VIT1/CCC1 transporter family protein [Pseudolabrys sp.]
MPATPHVEQHFYGSESVRDVVIGMADGLTVPFALAAGLSAAVASTHVIVTAGLAEIAAGAIAMGLGGYLAAKTDQEHYATEEQRESREVDQFRDHEIRETEEILRKYGLDGQALDQVVQAITSDKKRWVDFLMRFELDLERPEAKRAPISAITIGGSYAVGGLIPLLPYILTANVSTALTASVLVTGMTLAVFGAVKGRLTGANMIKAGTQTLLVGGIAAGAAFYIASLFG